MSRRENREKKQSNKIFRKIITVALFLICVCVVFKFAPNYIRDDIKDKTNFVINNSNVTRDLKKDILIENGVIYVAKEDISNFFDSYIYHDEKYDQIITGSDTRIAAIGVGKNTMNDNGEDVKIKGSVIKKDGTYYIPFSELADIYNVKTEYIEETDTIVVDSLNRELVVADSNKNTGVKYKATEFSRNVDKVKRGDSITVVNDSLKDGWVKVRTKNGSLGYMKENTLTNHTVIREEIKTSEKFNGDISMIWDYFSEYGEAPSRTSSLKGVNVVSPTFFTLKRLGKGEMDINVGDAGKAYIEWAHQNNYQVWPSISNNSMIDTTSEIMNDYKLRQGLINQIVSLVVNYNLDGINIDFENMYAKDKSLFSRFIIELKPRLNEIGAVLSVDVTAPDGSENWSMCYDRHTIGKVADYIVFMAYDQHGESSAEAGSTAGYDWVKVNLDKFVGTQEEIDPEKIILGIPFYARVWWESEGELKSSTVFMKDIDSILPSNAKKTWDDDVKQYVVEYNKNGTKYKLWAEDEKSIEEKLSLIKEYKLAGAAYWQKGGEMQSIWDVVVNKLNLSK